MILQSLWDTKERIVAMNKQLAANFVNDVAEAQLTQNEVGADLEATLDVALRLGNNQSLATQHRKFLKARCKLLLER